MTIINERRTSQATTPTAAVPRGHTFTSLLGLGPIPITQVINTHALVAEANRSPRPTEGLTQLEDVVQSSATRRAQRWLDRFVTKTIEPLIRTIKAEHAETQWLGELIDQLTETSMIGPTGEQLAPAEARHTHNLLREKTAAETRDGSKKHTTSAPHRVRDTMLLALDFPVFLFAMIGLLNVNIRLIFHDFATTVMAIVAAMFALLGTVLVAVVMRRLGRRHRDYKGHSGGIEAGRETISVTAELAGVATVIAILAIVMASRVFVEGETAHAPLPLIIALAVLFATLIGFSAYLNYRSEFDNGSTETDQIQHLSLQIRGRELQIDAHQNTRNLKIEQSGVNTSKLNRAIATGRSTALKIATTAKPNQAIHLARSYSSNPNTTLPQPPLDFSRLDLVQNQAAHLTARQTAYETSRTLYADDLFTYHDKEM